MLQAIKPEQEAQKRARTRAKIINTFRLLTVCKMCIYTHTRT